MPLNNPEAYQDPAMQGQAPPPPAQQPPAEADGARWDQIDQMVQSAKSKVSSGEVDIASALEGIISTLQSMYDEIASGGSSTPLGGLDSGPGLELNPDLET